ncbi:protein PML isoform X1 [Sceloporus undulatus]|uniref:protein PML isoform X1 n=1 Tax=Sceloporus undulatus TaxID=8520 RepID=UPI001C4D001F|nr:protein PML isoform X1 [Sceloporus undulatus]
MNKDKSQVMEEDFQFLLCEKCQGEAKNPKLLPCLHTFCLECLEENKPISQCPICRISIQRASGVSFQDNVLFAHLQAKLNTYQKITTGQDLVCDRCRGAAEFWCSECEEFLCKSCYEAHQWYLKQKSHEAQKLSDLQNDTAQSFLEGARKSSHLFCSEPAHNSQLVSIYCRGCRKPLCCSCALLDSEHYNAKLYSNIHVEIKNRKEELGRMKEDLGEKRKSYENARCSIHERLQQLEKVRNETRDQIQAQVEEMIQWIQKKGEDLMEKVDQQLCQERGDVERKLQNTERIVRRMEASERLVEKMNLFASDQEVMDMQPFIKESLEELRKEKLPAVGFWVQTENFAEVKSELQALYKRVKGDNDAVCCTVSSAFSLAPVVNSEVVPEEKSQPSPQDTQVISPSYKIRLKKTAHGFVPSIISPVKRPVSQTEKSVQAFPKIMKVEDRDCEAGETSSRHIQELPRSSQPLPSQTSTPEKEQRGFVNSVEVLEHSPSENAETEPASILISSSDETEDEVM